MWETTSKNMVKKLSFFLLATCFLALANSGQSRPITRNTSSVVVSDGIHDVQQPTYIHYNSLMSSDSCDQTYGFMPCTTTLLGNIFLILVYGYVMFMAAKLLSSGSEILLEILGPGIIGGLVLPVLSSLPDATIILASGLSGSTETAQSQVSVGMGLLAGSTVMLLTILWGSCLVVGKCDIEGSSAVDLKDTKRFSLTGSGVSTDIWTSYVARIMVISVIPFIIVQLTQVFSTTSQTRIAILISLIVSVSLLLSYSLYQIFQPWIQKRKIAYAKHKHVISGILKHLRMQSLGSLLTDSGEPNREVIQKLFKTIDKNSDGYLSATELRALVIGIQFEIIDMDIDEAVENLMKDFDASHDSHIDVDEFVKGISRWLIKARRSAVNSEGENSQTTRILNNFYQEIKTEQDLLGYQSDEEPVNESTKSSKWNVSKAVLMLLLGTIIAAVFADPLVDTVDNFSTASSIPSFFVSFVILPFACSSEVVSTLIFASRKQLKTSSLTYSAIYGSVTMGNILSLAVFLGLVYFRNLKWNFSAEVLVILIVCIVMGVIASFRTTFPLWMSLMAYALYPFSLLLVYVLNYVFGLS